MLKDYWNHPPIQDLVQDKECTIEQLESYELTRRKELAENFIVRMLQPKLLSTAPTVVMFASVKEQKPEAPMPAIPTSPEKQQGFKRKHG